MVSRGRVAGLLCAAALLMPTQAAPALAAEPASVTRAAVVGAPRPYVIPDRYLQPVAAIPKPKGVGFSLKAGWNGAKVSKVQRRLGLGLRHETMDRLTRSRVRTFQRRHRLRATGVVDLKTWRALGFSKASWTRLDGYRAKVLVRPGATRSQHVEAFVKTALRYRGHRYVWGGANAPADGVDCTGLVLQAMYGSGLNPSPITTVKHAGPNYPTGTRIFEYRKLQHVPLSQRRRGDVIFYGNASGITHAAIYLGRGTMVEAPSHPVVHVTTYRSKGALATVVRPFPLG